MLQAVLGLAIDYIYGPLQPVTSNSNFRTFNVKYFINSSFTLAGPAKSIVM